MDTIRQQILSARRRLNLQRFFGVVPWTVFACLLLAALAAAVPKIWVIGVDPRVWLAGWLLGALGAGLLTAVAAAFLSRRGMLDAALEIDRRFALKERVSSAWMLRPAEAETAAGQALLDDAARRVEGARIGEAFRLRIGWPALLPLIPACVGFVLVLIPDAARENAAAATGDALVRQQIQRSAAELGRKLAKRGDQAQEQGLKDAEQLFRQLRKDIEELNRRDDVDRQRALVRLNELSKQLAERRRALGDPDQVQRQLERLKTGERGPADRLADALQRGDPQQALQELKRLMEQLQSGQLTDQQKEQLARQLRDVQRQMQELVDRHAQAKEELERRIQQKLSEGDLEGAGKLQRQLERLQSQDQALGRLQELAGRFEKASDSLQKGDPQQAAKELSELAAELGEMQSQMEQLENIDEAMQEITGAKAAMNCDRCDGEGCAECQGDSNGGLSGEGDTPGQGLGEGTGQGDRPEQQTETGVYESRVRAQPRPGEAVRTGNATGPNQAGLSQQQIRDEIAGALREEADPLADQRLPRSQQDHVRQYYERRRKGE